MVDTNGSNEGGINEGVRSLERKEYIEMDATQQRVDYSA